MGAQVKGCWEQDPAGGARAQAIGTGTSPVQKSTSFKVAERASDRAGRGHSAGELIANAGKFVLSESSIIHNQARHIWDRLGELLFSHLTTAAPSVIRLDRVDIGLCRASRCGGNGAVVVVEAVVVVVVGLSRMRSGCG